MNAFVIDREALADNIRCVLARAGERKLYAVVKGGGYGFGLDEYIRILLDCGVTAFAVTEPHEAAAIRAAGADTQEILMLRSTAVEEELRQLMSCHAVITVGSSRAAAVANSLAADMCAAPYPVHIKIDTGMGRYGFSTDETEEILAVFKYMSALKVKGMFTHLSCAFKSKRKTAAARDAFFEVEDAVRDAGFDPGCIHYANSCALFRFGKSWDLRDAVRVGSALTGRLAYPVRSSGLKRVGYLEGRICEVRWLKPGATVGYGGAYRTKHGVRIAVIPFGYSHGFAVEKVRDSFRFRDCLRYILQDVKKLISREKIWVTINGKQARVLGHIGMLHTVVDVTNIGCDVGDRATVAVSPLYISPDVPRSFRLC